MACPYVRHSQHTYALPSVEAKIDACRASSSVRRGTRGEVPAPSRLEMFSYATRGSVTLSTLGVRVNAVA